MEFSQKLQALRKSRDLTQEELSSQLYVSRTAISKWESGRGYPNIESLKAIAAFFGITVDELLSTDEMLSVAEANSRQKDARFRDLIYGLLDLSMALLFFLPFFASRVDNVIESTSLVSLNGVMPYLKILFFTITSASVIIGVITLALQNIDVIWWQKIKTCASVSVGVAALLLFMLSSHPYAAIFAFTLLAIKVAVLVKRP